MRQTGNFDVSIVAVEGFEFLFESRNLGFGGSLMKPIDGGSFIGLDRLATWNEVMCAISVSAKGVLALEGACNVLRVMDSDFSGSAYNLPEDDMWLVILGEMPASESN
jgi:hypothetical protein